MAKASAWNLTRAATAQLVERFTSAQPFFCSYRQYTL
jgi:hypothetical protein